MERFGFDKSVGVNRKGYRTTVPEGPKRNAVIQAGFSALANGATTLIISHVGLEALSKQLAARLELDDLARIMAEWIIPKSEWMPLVEEELARLTDVLDTVASGYLPEPRAFESR